MLGGNVDEFVEKSPISVMVRGTLGSGAWEPTYSTSGMSEPLRSSRTQLSVFYCLCLPLLRC